MQNKLQFLIQLLPKYSILWNVKKKKNEKKQAITVTFMSSHFSLFCFFSFNKLAEDFRSNQKRSNRRQWRTVKTITKEQKELKTKLNMNRGKKKKKIKHELSTTWIQLKNDCFGGFTFLSFFLILIPT